ncbi:MAG: hypothetical protein ACYTEK_20065 [Planctomycetota bacterium]|jgi:hypothetical protein
MAILRTICSAFVFASFALMQNTAHAEEPWRFITLVDWHIAEIFVQPNRYPEAAKEAMGGLKMLKANYGGELVMLPGDSNKGHWDTEQFIKSFKPGLTPAEAILQAGKLCYSGMVDAFKEAGYSRMLMAGRQSMAARNGGLEMPTTVPRGVCQCFQRQSRRRAVHL